MERKTNGSGVVSYMSHKLLVKAESGSAAPYREQASSPCAHRNVELCVYRDKMRALYKGRFYDIELVEEPAAQASSGPRGRSHAPEVLREIIAKTLKAEGKQGSDQRGRFSKGKNGRKACLSSESTGSRSEACCRQAKRMLV